MRARGAFSLIEVMVVLVVLTILLSGLALPLGAQIALRRTEETRRQLDEARDALLGFAAAHARLPCPASASSFGEEIFAGGENAASGGCAAFQGGFLPAATLGLAPVDAEGFARDAWSNRIRYAVFGDGASINGIANPLTRANGLQAATLPEIAAAPHFLFICSTGAAATRSSCGPAANQLTKRAAFLLLSPGANGANAPIAGGDEARNLAGDLVFVQRDAASGADGFDDLVQWTPIHLVVNRLIVAGRLP
jgi:prepilin-type N-terminal cleavage/methylation domain-containing protein